MQSRNALIGNFTEKYSTDLLQGFANSKGFYAVQGAICNEIGLTPQSPADVVLCKNKGREQVAKDIAAIFGNSSATKAQRHKEKGLFSNS